MFAHQEVYALLQICALVTVDMVVQTVDNSLVLESLNPFQQFAVEVEHVLVQIHVHVLLDIVEVNVKL